jgi:hypothetical protein
MSTGDDLIRRLPELPQRTFEAAGRLVRSDRGPFVTLLPHKLPLSPDPPVSAHAIQKSSFAVRQYFTQALYPRVVCYDPGILADGLKMSVDPQPFPGRDRPPTNIAAVAGQERFYKLSVLRSAPLRNPLWCSVKYGPWLAVAKETESCFDGVPNKWEFFIVEMPQVAVFWFGEWEDMPAVPSLAVTMSDKVLAGSEMLCCSGFQWCPTTQSCLPLNVECQDPIPA